MLIAIPSKGRASKVKSLRLITSATVYVPEAELPDYRRSNPKATLVAVPNSVRGITPTRNWILDHTDDRWVVFVDDDVKKAGWLEVFPFRMKQTPRLTEAEWLAEWVRLFEVTEGLGWRVWGVATQSAPRAWYAYRPFIWHTYVTASCMGMINDRENPLRFDPEFTVKEDYEICLRAITEDGGIVGCRYLYWENDHWTQEGGCKSYRTQAIERRCTERLMALYPGMIRRVTRGGSEFSIQLEF